MPRKPKPTITVGDRFIRPHSGLEYEVVYVSEPWVVLQDKRVAADGRHAMPVVELMRHVLDLARHCPYVRVTPEGEPVQEVEQKRVPPRSRPRLFERDVSSHALLLAGSLEDDPVEGEQ